MPFSIVAWSQSEDEEGAYLAKTAVPDEIAITSGDILYVPAETPVLLGAYAAIGGTVEGSAYLQSPSLRATALFDIQPTQEGIKPSGDESLRLQPTSPIPLVGGEGLEAFVLSNPGAAEVHTVVAWLADAAIAPITGTIFHVKFTAAITETVSVWTSGAITLRQTLPVGRYAVVGAAMWGTSGVAFRFLPKGYANRPGFITHGTEGNHGSDLQRNGGLGTWFEFDSKVPPQIEWLAMATAGASQAGILDLIKVG